jgi:hypothetical protein
MTSIFHIIICLHFDRTLFLQLQQGFGMNFGLSENEKEAMRVQYGFDINFGNENEAKWNVIRIWYDFFTLKMETRLYVV